jgi:hypothetical protein
MDITIPCPCPPKVDGAPRHESDTVTLRAVMDFPTAVLLQKSLEAKIVREITGAAEAGRASVRLAEPDVLALMTQFYVRNCVIAWTLVDEKGKPVEVTPDAIEMRLERHLDAAMTVAAAADEVYKEVALPLALRVVSSFRPTQTTEPTSRKPAGSPKRQKRSKPSSISTIPMADTAKISGSQGGVSKSLPSSVTAA